MFITTVRIISSEIDRLKRRVVKYFRLGNNVHTSVETGPFGIDSNPVKDMIAIEVMTRDRGKTYVIGYLNKNQISDLGEIRFYSTDEAGAEQTYHWLKNDGTQEFGGNTNNLARFQELEAAFNRLKSDHNALVQAFNSHTHPSNGTPPSGAGIPVPTSIADISGAKIEHLKTN